MPFSARVTWKKIVLTVNSVREKEGISDILSLCPVIKDKVDGTSSLCGIVTLGALKSLQTLSFKVSILDND